MRKPTLIEQAKWWRHTHPYQSTTNRVIHAYTLAMMGFTDHVRPNPYKCECGHSYGDHTNHPKAYGCIRCLCLGLPEYKR